MEAARARLAKLFEASAPEIARRCADRYGRTIALVLDGGVDVSSMLLRKGYVKRLGQIGGGALGLGLAMLIIERLISRRMAKALL